ncbi:MAG: prepilin peptidase [Lachnospiraceae bacterium]|nr:prepilin peptidase [Lachnospiraceae bacterium]
MVLTAATIFDVKDKRIPNIIVVIGYAALLGARIVTDAAALGDFMLGSIYPLGILLILFIFGMFGAGDIKLYCLVSAVTGIRDFNIVLVISMFLGAIYALFKMIYKKNLVIRMQYLAAYFTGLFLTKTVSPYCVREEGDGNVVSFSGFILAGFIVYLYWRCVIGTGNIGIM